MSTISRLRTSETIASVVIGDSQVPYGAFLFAMVCGVLASGIYSELKISVDVSGMAWNISAHVGE